MVNINLFSNIINNFKLLQNDFIGISFNLTGASLVFLNFIFAIILFTIFYLLGNRIRSLIFGNIKKLPAKPFINIALGYIVFGTGIALLGVFSLLYPLVLYIYIFLIIVFSLSPFNNLKEGFNDIFLVFFNIKEQFKKNKIIFLASFLFLFVAALRLIPPEIGEDAVGYHTDLPKLYLYSHSLMLESKESLHVIPYPQLGEMPYVISEFIGLKDSTRYIHFIFYVVIVLLLFDLISKKGYKFSQYAPLLFVTAPVVIRYSSSAYVDFPMVFCFLLALIIISGYKKLSYSTICLAGIIFGGALSTKLWLLIYTPLAILYVIFKNIQFGKKYLFKLSLIFLFSSLLVLLIWNIRAYILSGNPIFPIFSSYGESKPDLESYLGINWSMFSLSNLIVFSPLFFLGTFFLIINFKKTINAVKDYRLFLFFILISLEQIFVKVTLGRHLLAWYTVSVMTLSSAVGYVLDKYKIYKYIFSILYLLLFFYYFVNTLLILPYGFGWADKNKYLTRVLFRDNSSYYDFDHLFDRQISEKDYVATYGIFGYFYANFRYIDVAYIFDNKQGSFNLLKDRGVSKLLVKGGDINWFCKRMRLENCTNVKLLSTYPKDTMKYNLYSIER